MKFVYSILILTLLANPAFARWALPVCVPSPSQDAPPCPVKDEPVSFSDSKKIAEVPVAQPISPPVVVAPAVPQLPKYRRHHSRKVK